MLAVVSSFSPRSFSYLLDLLHQMKKSYLKMNFYFVSSRNRYYLSILELSWQVIEFSQGPVQNLIFTGQRKIS